MTTVIAHHIAGLPEDLLLPLVYSAGALLAGARVVALRRAQQVSGGFAARNRWRRSVRSRPEVQARSMLDRRK